MGNEGFDFYEINFKRIAANIKALRKQHHMTQAQVAEKLNIDTQYYAVIERGDNPNRNFSIDKVLTACKLFNCTPNDIMGTDFIVQNHNREILIENIIKEINGMTEHQLSIMLQYIQTVMNMI